MEERSESLALQATPELREVMRRAIVVDGVSTSWALADAVGLHHGLAVRMLERFEAVGALRVVRDDDQSGGVGRQGRLPHGAL
jgi:hypothetical protein